MYEGTARRSQRNRSKYGKDREGVAQRADRSWAQSPRLVGPGAVGRAVTCVQPDGTQGSTGGDRQAGVQQGR
jgi:hypothetical protein